MLLVVRRHRESTAADHDTTLQILHRKQMSFKYTISQGSNTYRHPSRIGNTYSYWHHMFRHTHTHTQAHSFNQMHTFTLSTWPRESQSSSLASSSSSSMTVVNVVGCTRRRGVFANSTFTPRQNTR